MRPQPAARPKNPSTVAREELLAKIAEIRAALQTDADNGIAYATDKLESWQYTGNKSGVADTLPELNDALAAADTLVADDAATTEDLRSAASALDSQYAGLRTLPETNTSIPGTTGTVIKADTGLPMQAHGGSAMALKEGTGDGCVNYDLDGDGDITEGKAVYLWSVRTRPTIPALWTACAATAPLICTTGPTAAPSSTPRAPSCPLREGSEKAIISSPGASGTGTTQDYNVMQLSATEPRDAEGLGQAVRRTRGCDREPVPQCQELPARLCHRVREGPHGPERHQLDRQEL